MLRNFLLLIMGLLWSTGAQAQAGGGDFLRSIGKIYVVVAVIVAVFLGIIFFLIYLDRRLTNIENQIDHHEQ